MDQGTEPLRAAEADFRLNLRGTLLAPRLQGRGEGSEVQTEYWRGPNASLVFRAPEPKPILPIGMDVLAARNRLP